MLRPAALHLIFFAFAQAASALGVAGGLGVESRLQKEVNPDFVEGKVLGQVFAQARFTPRWTLHTEVGYEQHTSSSGGFLIGNKTYVAGVWGRYVFVTEHNWQPFVSAGLGANFDTVSSRFGNAHDERSGIRYFGGAGAGVSAVFFKYLLVEAEARVAGVQDRKEPMLSALLRAGFLLDDLLN